jgi:hypothetical protein
MEKGMHYLGLATREDDVCLGCLHACPCGRDHDGGSNDNLSLNHDCEFCVFWDSVVFSFKNSCRMRVSVSEGISHEDSNAPAKNASVGNNSRWCLPAWMIILELGDSARGHSATF